MRNEEISARDHYIESLLEAENPFKAGSRAAAQDLGLARISLSAAEGNLVSFLLKAIGARRCVEIGTLTGLSAQYILEALPADGKLWTFEKSEEHADRAREIFSKAGLDPRVQLMVGDAQVRLEEITAFGPFDAVFIDGNKAAYGHYLAWAEKNLRRGGLILADNVFLGGAVWGATPAAEERGPRFSEKQVRVMREFNRRLSDMTLYDSTLVPTAEGLFCALKKF